jgi:hypothetical protein
LLGYGLNEPSLGAPENTDSGLGVIISDPSWPVYGRGLLRWVVGILRERDLTAEESLVPEL